jgi:long-subunit acyl-CoA synthetase (AMP-forming)
MLSGMYKAWTASMAEVASKERADDDNNDDGAAGGGAATKAADVGDSDSTYVPMEAVFARSDSAKNPYYRQGIDYMASTIDAPTGLPQLCGIVHNSNPYRTTPGDSWQQSAMIPTENSFGPSMWRNVRFLKGLRTTPVDGNTSPVELFATACEKFATRRALGWRDITLIKDGVYGGKACQKWEMTDYTWMTFKELGDAVDAFAGKLCSIGLVKGDIISLFAETSKEWQIACQACFKLGITVATVYATLGPQGLKHGLSQTESKAIIFHSQLTETVEAVLSDCPALKYGICIVDPTCAAYEASEPKPKTCNKPLSVADAAARLSSITVLDYNATSWAADGSPSPAWAAPKVEPGDTAVIMYTSGSTGTPKGVEITMANFCCAVASGGDAIGALVEDETYIGYLPLAHIFEMMVEAFMLVQGARIGYGTTKTLSDKSAHVCTAEFGGTSHGDAPTLKPTMMCAVPLVLDRIKNAVLATIEAAGKTDLFQKAYADKKAAYAVAGDAPAWNLILFKKKLRAMLGGRVRAFISGGAPLAAETQTFMHVCFGAPVLQGYGLTETCAGGTVASPIELRCGEVGAPTCSVDIMLREWRNSNDEDKLMFDPNIHPASDDPNVKGHGIGAKAHAAQGEVLISGGIVTKGYFKMPEKTAETFILDASGKRWFCTGDIGEFTSRGTLKIIGRKKNIQKLSTGEYVPLDDVEAVMRGISEVENVMACVRGTESYYIAVVQRPPGDLTSKTQTDASTLAALKDLFRTEAVKAKGYRAPKKVILVDEQWGPENNLCTAAMKLKRVNAEAFYKARIDGAFAAGL